MTSLKPWLKIYWPRLLGSVLLLAFFFGNQGFRSLVRNWLELRRLRQEILVMNQQEGQLSQRLAALRAGSGSVERLARKELGYIRPGEIEYRFPPPR
ncbi:MAG: hypothetical protein A3J74_08075 [Elusimicrobia bacterium RIFCSPHIGHO2_02_FULL_57_9]|nr:MAG: hypothetical protein A3J74_08075 [Elusimicrobia bacterium RIFCSPHIGHO2_02_FULL_57_9]